MTADTQAQIRRVLEDADQPMDVTEEEPLQPDLHPDRTRQFTHTNFSRMRLAWKPEEVVKLDEIRATVREILQTKFRMAYNVIDDVYMYVRLPLRDEQGQVRLGPDKRPRWELDEHGDPVEDWSELPDRVRSGFLHKIVIHLFEWEQANVEMWAEAMYAKAIWEEKFAHGFTALPGYEISGRPTVDDKTQVGHLSSTDERYRGIFLAQLSRSADSIVRSMVRIQRLLEGTDTR